MKKALKIGGFSLGGLILLAVVLRLLLFESWTIPEDDAVLGASVTPTLRAGDSVLLFKPGSPGFGDLVRCKDPDNPGKFVVGRIVGLENDLVEIQNRTLLVNGRRFSESDACKNAFFTIEHPDTGTLVEMSCSRVPMAGGWYMRGVVRGDFNAGDAAETVGPGRVFLMSDDRDFHEDSRDFGTVPRESCDGPIVFRLWSKAGWSDTEARMTAIH